ncbi:ABC transporter permease [Rhodoluna sp.]|uniref:ABC transporter permease n=1 Tax=Rhodoluna sp. TaxID=1969481 RepID=UPI0025FE65F8|nr:ABC transporter permease [Rhodoluna sp.]
MKKAFREIVNGNIWLSFLAVVASFIVGGILIAFSSETVQTTATYLTARPTDFISAVWNAVFGAYDAMFRGAVFNYKADNLTFMIRPITETLAYATPIVMSGLGLAVAFKSGLFNIGAAGQIVFGAMFAGWVAIFVDLPGYIHFPIALLAGILGGALWGALAGFLKAATGANEVIVTIMFNYIAILLLGYLLKTPVLKAPGSVNPISPPVHDSAKYALLMGDQFRVHAGLIAMLIAVVFVWWLLNRSSIGFQFRALGHNPNAAKVAGINIGATTVLVMAVSGALSGLAGTSQIMGTEKFLTLGVAASFGFDAITVALLGRSNPWGVLMAGILFGGLRAGAVTMQANQGVPIDIVLVVQSMIVLFIAAPPLVRSMFRIKPQKEDAK